MNFYLRLYITKSQDSKRSITLERGCCIRSHLATKLLHVVLFHEDITQRDLKKCRPRYGQSRGTMQRRRSCQNSCSIHVYVVPTAAEYVQRRVCFVYVQSSLPENVVFLFVRACTMPRILYLSCGIPFPVWTPGIISGLTSVVVWLSR